MHSSSFCRVFTTLGFIFTVPVAKFQMISETFGDLLFAPGPEGLKDFPSPLALKRKIIISTKPPKEYLEAKVPKKEENELKQEKALNEEVAWGQEVTYSETRLHDNKV